MSLFEPTRARPIHLGAPGAVISKKDLQAVELRFKSVQQRHIARIQQNLLPKQRDFLELLPLLLHQNHPSLPGFITLTAPAGIQHYQPGKQTLQYARRFAKSFVYRKPLAHNLPVWGVFLMGSVSSVAFAAGSDMDIWLCHDPALTAAQHRQLADKVCAIERWATGLGLAVHFFLIDCERFRQGEDTPISDESSGKMQHYLLLEEFYRTAVYVAGRIPGWWLVPPEQEANDQRYLQHLTERRFIAADKIIDFGSLSQTPPEEFVTVTLWHLYKATHAPHKSLLKLMLLESYASHYPNIPWLATAMKAKLYSGQYSLVELDSYLLICQRLERYLQDLGQAERIELVRRSLVLKIAGLPVAELTQQRRKLLEHLAASWQWPMANVQALLSGQYWQVDRVQREHELLFKQLAQCYRVIQNFTRRHLQRLASNDDAELISRKMLAYLNKKPGKIEFLSTRALLAKQSPDFLLIEQPGNADDSVWQLVRQSNAAVLQQRYSVCELLTWLLVNRLVTDVKQLQIESLPGHAPPVKRLGDCLRVLHRFLNLIKPLPEADLAVCRSSNRIVQVLWLVNLAEPVLSQDLSFAAQGNPFFCSADRQCLLESVDYVWVTAWGEIYTGQAKGFGGLLAAMATLLNQAHDLNPGVVTAYCPQPLYGVHFQQTLLGLFWRLARLMNTPAERYLLDAGVGVYCAEYQASELAIKALADDAALWQELGRPVAGYSPVHCQPGALSHTPLPRLLEHNRPGVVQVFAHQKNGATDIYVLDERGGLYREVYRDCLMTIALKHCHFFLDNIGERYFGNQPHPVEYYQIHADQVRVLDFTRQDDIASEPPALAVRVAGCMRGDHLDYTVYVNENEFSSVNHGRQFFDAAVTCILDHRLNGNQYPVRISDIDLPLTCLGVSHDAALQTLHLLNYKRLLEKRLQPPNLS
ncbi:MAG: class I adenylate cyclase [Methylococcales bacterium]|nr:class I adenylate cyclase [Methylococcales bacterium]